MLHILGAYACILSLSEPLWSDRLSVSILLANPGHKRFTNHVTPHSRNAHECKDHTKLCTVRERLSASSQRGLKVKCQSSPCFCARMRWYGPERCIGSHRPVYAWSTAAWFAIAPLMIISGPYLGDGFGLGANTRDEEGFGR